MNMKAAADMREVRAAEPSAGMIPVFFHDMISLKGSAGMKASEEEVCRKISMFLHGSFPDGQYVNESDLPRIAALLKEYSNVSVSVGKSILNDGHLDCIITVSRFLAGSQLRYEIRSHGIRKMYYDSLIWIDEIEGWDAFLD